MTTMNPKATSGRTPRAIPLDAESSPLAKAVLFMWAAVAAGLSVVALVAALIRVGESFPLVVSGVGVSIGSLLAAAFLWQAYSRVGSRSR
jgi:hypothetical protein